MSEQCPWLGPEGTVRSKVEGSPRFVSASARNLAELDRLGGHKSYIAASQRNQLGPALLTLSGGFLYLRLKCWLPAPFPSSRLPEGFARQCEL